MSMKKDVKIWDSEKFTINCAGMNVYCHGEKNALNISWDEDVNAKKVLLSGKVKYSKNPNRSGTCKITLLNNSDSFNNFLKMLELMRLFPVKMPIVVLDDNEGGSSIVLYECVFKSYPEIVKGQEVAEVDVVFMFGDSLPIGLTTEVYNSLGIE